MSSINNNIKEEDLKSLLEEVARESFTSIKLMRQLRQLKLNIKEVESLIAQSK